MDKGVNMHVPVKELPPVVQAALKSVGYHRRDISVEARERISLANGGSDGCRAFGCLVDLSTGQFEVKYGSWGGPNMFCPRNQIDLDDRLQDLPVGAVYIDGSEGGGRPTYASLKAHPKNLAKLLPARVEVSLDEQKVINALRYKGEYRKTQLAKTKAEALESCVSKGLVKRSKAGALSLTTEGQNSLAYRAGYSAPWETED